MYLTKIINLLILLPYMKGMGLILIIFFLFNTYFALDTDHCVTDQNFQTATTFLCDHEIPEQSSHQKENHHCLIHCSHMTQALPQIVKIKIPDIKTCLTSFNSQIVLSNFKESLFRPPIS